ncbi:GTP pyrophosphokinase [Hydrogenophaga electricum]|uniref:GTP pyrophosphokinase n=2 Tax=Hydrogenophaga electricum TaxID=1230953 RepID=A0ABQ6C3H3_9BURK|nr:GTP pyrophosphokinase [Hydrogenophaga electricum]
MTADNDMKRTFSSAMEAPAADGSAAPAAARPSAIVAATAASLPADSQALARARAFAEPLLAFEQLDTGENILAHADAVAGILRDIGGSEAMQAASYLVYACRYLNRPQEVITKAFGENYAALAMETTKLVQLQHQAREKAAEVQARKAEERQVAQEQALPGSSSAKMPVSELAANQTENVRKMLLAFSRDLRVVMLRLASRLQTLRYFAATKGDPGAALASESLSVFAPLANRLGIWQIKWEMEDLAFRFLEPQTYKEVARLLEDKRIEREQHVEQVRSELEASLQAQGIQASVQGRPKHIYSIVKKMRGKSLDFSQVFDIRALRVVVPAVDDCYAVLALVHARFTPVAEEFDDYIAKPKPNGYQSLHTVVRDAQGRAFEIQIRTQAMHDHAEHGVAAHWAYKEAGSKGYAGVSASSEYDAKIAVLRQLLAWERDLSGGGRHDLFDDRIYVLTPDAAIVELPRGATPVDFAYSVHTSLGHRCRGARVDNAMVTLNTPLQNGQTVEIIAAKEGGPSRDWLNPDLGYLVGHRAKSKVRAWFNAQALEVTVARGREVVEKLLQREGKTAVRHDDLAAALGLSSAQELFEQVGKDELSLKAIEAQLRPAEPVEAPEVPLLRKPRRPTDAAPGSVLVVGVGALMTQLARCCRPAPPDDICGFVTRGKGVSVHRSDCTDFRHLQRKHPDRVIEVQWGDAGQGARDGKGPVYPVDVAVEAQDRQGLLRDISDVFAREKINVIGVQTQSVKGVAWMTFTIEITDARQVARAMSVVGDVSGVRMVRRK